MRGAALQAWCGFPNYLCVCELLSYAGLPSDGLSTGPGISGVAVAPVSFLLAQRRRRGSALSRDANATPAKEAAPASPAELQRAASSSDLNTHVQRSAALARAAFRVLSAEAPRAPATCFLLSQPGDDLDAPATMFTMPTRVDARRGSARAEVGVMNR